MNQLTPGEEEIMQILWKLNKATVTAILQEMPEPKRAYNTISTFVRILEKKGVVDHRQNGAGYIYIPLITKETYINYLMNKLLNDYFDGSLKKMLIFLSKTDPNKI